jgi:hypothetical protein
MKNYLLVGLNVVVVNDLALSDRLSTVLFELYGQVASFDCAQRDNSSKACPPERSLRLVALSAVEGLSP